MILAIRSNDLKVCAKKSSYLYFKTEGVTEVMIWTAPQLLGFSFSSMSAVVPHSAPVPSRFTNLFNKCIFLALVVSVLDVMS